MSKSLIEWLMTLNTTILQSFLKLVKFNNLVKSPTLLKAIMLASGVLKVSMLIHKSWKSTQRENISSESLSNGPIKVNTTLGFFLYSQKTKLKSIRSQLNKVNFHLFRSKILDWAYEKFRFEKRITIFKRKHGVRNDLDASPNGLLCIWQIKRAKLEIRS